MLVPNLCFEDCHCWELRKSHRSKAPKTDRCTISNQQTRPLWSHYLCRHRDAEPIAFACTSTDSVILPQPFDFLSSKYLRHLRQAPLNLPLSSLQKSWEWKRERGLERCLIWNCFSPLTRQGLLRCYVFFLQSCLDFEARLSPSSSWKMPWWRRHLRKIRPPVCKILNLFPAELHHHF